MGEAIVSVMVEKVAKGASLLVAEDLLEGKSVLAGEVVEGAFLLVGRSLLVVDDSVEATFLPLDEDFPEETSLSTRLGLAAMLEATAFDTASLSSLVLGVFSSRFSLLRSSAGELVDLATQQLLRQDRALVSEADSVSGSDSASDSPSESPSLSPSDVMEESVSYQSPSLSSALLSSSSAWSSPLSWATCFFSCSRAGSLSCWP